ncbi:MAG: hypothetical protein JWO67_6455, partial [Streptosporangiaceae bacterium]|nr:hypothetical protein [Streptosporangiaceae bacterium]
MIKSRTKGTSETIQSVIVGLTDTDMEGLFIAFKDLGLRHRMLDRTHSHAGKHLINQVSMAYTLLTFSFTPLVAMRRANEQAPAEDKTLSEENREIWLRMWNIVGSLMGI